MTKKRKIITFISIAIIFLVGFAVYNKDLIKAHYYDIKYNHFKTGDRVYAYKKFISPFSSKIDLYRLAKSATTADNMLIKSGNVLMSDSMRKYKSSYLGTYLKREFRFYDSQKGKQIQLLISIIPNNKILLALPGKGQALPVGYNYIDSNYYFNFYVGSAQETEF